MDLIYGQRCPGCGVVCATLDAEHLDDCEYVGEIRLLTQSEADHLREEESDARRRHGHGDSGIELRVRHDFATDPDLDRLYDEGPTGLAGFYSQRSA